MKHCPECGTALEARIVEGVERRACAAPGCRYVFWDNPIPVVAGIVRWGERYVLARNAKWPNGMFSMITGFLERNEAPAAALRRELKEELGLDLARATFIGHYNFLAANQLILAFLVEGTGDLALGDEIAETTLVAHDDLDAFDFGPLSLTAQIVRDVLRLYAGKRT